MNPADLAARLAANAKVFQHLLVDVSPEQARWKPTPEKWSLLQVINHLADEEREDFRTRVDLTLHHPGEPWPAIDPQGWVTAREYDRRDLGASLEDFLRERERSVEWLGTLGGADPAATYQHPKAGPITAGDLMGSWLAHDLIHIRQITRLHYEYLSQRVAPYSLGYAGPW